MDKLKAQFEKHIIVALFIFVTLLPVIATIGLFATIVFLQHNFLNWME